MIDTALLARICKTPGAPGFEDRVRKLVLQEIDGLVDSVRTDHMGNVIARVKGRSSERKVMCAAHMDEIGFIVTHVDDKGFVRFHTLGGFDPKTLTAQRVIVHGTRDVVGVMGSKPIHLMKPEERAKVTATSDYFIDLGMAKSGVDEIVSVGDPITRERELIEMGDAVNAKSLDNRVSVFILIETLKALRGRELPYDFYAAFTVQEEVGLRGAFTAASQVDPDFAIGLDVTIAFDVPGAQAHEAVTAMGEGAAIKIMDGSVICDPRMVRLMKQLADANDIPWQAEVLPAGGTDTGSLQRAGRRGAIAGAISIPCRHIHQVIEMCSKSDIAACTQLLTEVVAGIDALVE